MGCGSSKDGSVEPSGYVSSRRVSTFIPRPPEISVTKGANVGLDQARSRVIFIFGGPGSGKGRIVANLRSMFGMKLISGENIVLKYLPKKVQHSMTLTSTEEMAALIRKEPSHVTLEWLLRLMTHVVESDPEQFFIVDVVPNLRWLARNEHLVNNCAAELESFEHKIPVAFALNLSVPEEGLNKTLDYSHHNSSLPPGATIADEADNSRAKRRFKLHEQAAAPFIEYFSVSERLVSVDASSGAMEPLWDKVHELFTSLSLVAWRPVETVLVFAMEGLCVGEVDLGCSDMKLISLRDITTDPQASVEVLLEVLSEHIDSLADCSHYFVVDPAATSMMSATMSEFHKRSIVFSDVHDQTDACVNKFSQRMNAMVGGAYFKAVCSSEDETLLFPSSTDHTFCQQVALCMAEKHPSKR